MGVAIARCANLWSPLPYGRRSPLAPAGGNNVARFSVNPYAGAPLHFPA